VYYLTVVPNGYINDVLTKKNLRDIIGHVLNSTSVPETAAFLDNMKYGI
jgi:DNA-directed RNA polymerase subunit beta'